MIAYLDGVIRDKQLAQVVVDVGGVGYGVYVTNEDLELLELDKPAKLFIFEYIREQQHDLFGFSKKPTKALFEKLLEVNGVGPKMALNMLSIGSVENLKKAIAEGDLLFIQGASGVGKRVAERVVVDLKDKVGLLSSDSATDFLHVSSDDEAVQALIGLGFSSIEAAKALAGVDKGLPAEEKVRQALKVRN
ncbi:MAG TPA: Holliday junction branch migration protein RuvA [Candidatus Saccharimonadales bacterium]|nr:Holliday junction branch migration protein RuvA [Candidatus Saccharimonadales bacterium]